MRRFIALAVVAAMFAAVPLSHFAAQADPPRRKLVKVCVTGKNQSQGRVITVPAGAAGRITAAKVGCTSFKSDKLSNACICGKQPPDKK